jgi:hypothetical protein
MKKIGSIKFHVENNDYFGTLATVLNLLKHDISKCGHKMEIDVLDRKVDELVYLQNNYMINRKNN